MNNKTSTYCYLAQYKVICNTRKTHNSLIITISMSAHQLVTLLKCSNECLLLVKCALKKKNIEKSFINCSFVLFQADKLYRSIVAEQLIRNNS